MGALRLPATSLATGPGAVCGGGALSAPAASSGLGDATCPGACCSRDSQTIPSRGAGGAGGADAAGGARRAAWTAKRGASSDPACDWARRAISRWPARRRKASRRPASSRPWTAEARQAGFVRAWREDGHLACGTPPGATPPASPPALRPPASPAGRSHPRGTPGAARRHVAHGARTRVTFHVTPTHSRGDRVTLREEV